MPPVAARKIAGAVLLGVGEGAAAVAEQLAFEQLRRQRAQIHPQEDFVGASRQAVDLARDQFLAGAVLAQDQHIGVGGRGAADGVEHPAAWRRGADHAGFLMGGGGQAAVALAQLGRLRARAAQVQRRHQRRQQAFILPGLGDEIGGALLHRLDRQLHIAVGGHHHHHRLRIDGQHFGQPRQALRCRHRRRG